MTTEPDDNIYTLSYRTVDLYEKLQIKLTEAEVALNNVRSNYRKELQYSHFLEQKLCRIPNFVLRLFGINLDTLYADFNSQFKSNEPTDDDVQD